MAKIEHSYNYLAEESKVKFQHHVSSLFELQQFLLDKTASAKNPEAIFSDVRDYNVLVEWITAIATGLVTDHEIINRCNQHLQAQNRALSEENDYLLSRTVLNLKDLLKA